MTVQELAADYLDRFEQDTRDNGEKFWKVADGKELPELQKLCMDAHGDMLPDDWRYSFIVDALILLSDNEDEDRARDEVDADIYTHELTGWLHSRVDRYGYCDEAAEEFGKPEGLIQLLQWGAVP